MQGLISLNSGAKFSAGVCEGTAYSQHSLELVAQPESNLVVKLFPDGIMRDGGTGNTSCPT